VLPIVVAGAPAVGGGPIVKRAFEHGVRGRGDRVVRVVQPTSERVPESTREQPRGVMLDCGTYLPVNRAISYLNSSSSLLLPSGWWWWLVVPVVPVVPVVASSSGCLANSANLLLCFVARMERMRCKFKYCINSRLGAVRKDNFNNKN